MSTTLAHTRLMTGRYLRLLQREPAYAGFTMAQPVVWLLLFSQLFQRVADLPTFGETDYVTYLTPGIVVMTAVMTANWAGTGFVQDMERGVMDRTLASPVRRGALLGGNLAYHMVIAVVQTLVVVGIGLALGARFDGGVAGVLLVVVVAMLLSAFFTAMSCSLALALRSQEALIGMSQMLVLPLVFLSSLLIAPELLPGWIETVARFNPVDWAAMASREVLAANPDWEVVAWRGGLLLALAVLMSVAGTRSFRSYQRAA
jgi:ABC-2 type transport system permease protein